MKKKYFLLISCLFLSMFFIKDFYLRQVKATSSWYATFTYNDKTYAFSHNYQQTDWNSIIPGFANSVNVSPDGNAGDKGQNWCNDTLITDGEDNNFNDWFLPNKNELEAGRFYSGSNPWNLPYGAKLWSSSTHDDIGRYHRAFARTEEGNYILDKVEFNYARCVRIFLGPTPPPNLKTLLQNWGSNHPDFDFNADDKVNGLDFGMMLKSS